jgi:hypothetical protein
MSEIVPGVSSMRVTVTGIEQLVSNFAILPRSVASKYVDSGMKKHMKGYVPDLKARTVKGPTGNLRRSVDSKGEYKAPYRVMGLIGYTKIGKKGSHAHLLESGTKFRAPKSATALAIPSKFVSKYRYLKKTGVLSPSKSAYWYRAVRGMPKTRFFNAWQKSKRKTFVIGLETLLLASFNKAVAEVARRPG